MYAFLQAADINFPWWWKAIGFAGIAFISIYVIVSIFLLYSLIRGSLENLKKENIHRRIQIFLGWMPAISLVTIFTPIVIYENMKNAEAVGQVYAKYMLFVLIFNVASIVLAFFIVKVKKQFKFLKLIFHFQVFSSILGLMFLDLVTLLYGAYQSGIGK